jgi:hypothetical protein
VTRTDQGHGVTATDEQYLDDLVIHLRLARMPGHRIGAVLEETRRHLVDSGQSAPDAFGPVEEYAHALLASHGRAPEPGTALTRGELLVAAIQVVASYPLIFGLVALVGEGTYAIVPGHLAGLGLLIAGFAWPVWPALQAYLTRSVGFWLPWAATTATVAASVVLYVTWDAPELVDVPAVPSVAVSVAVFGWSWLRVWRQRDPVRRPTET